jgi:Asp-tRNA(Asn)/Glu-tRNA(Gln) amidotransferase A subunit family amidase
MSDQTYDLESVNMPYLVGLPLRLFVSALEGPLGRFLVPSLLNNMGFVTFRDMDVDAPPTLKPIHHGYGYATIPSAVPVNELPGPAAKPGPGFRFATVHDYAQAYRDGRVTPLEVAQRVINAIEDSNNSDPPLRAIIASYPEDVVSQAQASQERFEKGQPLSVFDGVPVGIKDEVDMVPYPTTTGTPFLGKESATRDSTVVERFRAAGALLIGKANMHEIGINVTGLNPHHGTVRNPYNLNHYTGGSSSGSGAAVAAGLCPVAIGADGGGSIRIPSSFCGVVGLKSTFGRVSEYGATPLCWSVAHLGPIAATATDAALGWGIVAGADLKEPDTLFQPPPTLKGWDNTNLSDLKIGLYWPWFRHSTDDMVSACEEMLNHFTSLGAVIVEVEIPGLEACRLAQTITIASEMAQAMDSFHEAHGKEHGLDIRTNLRLARDLSAQDYIKAQRVRTQTMETFNRVLREVDVIVTPATGLVAPPIKPGALPNGDSDLSLLVEIMRFAQPGNLTGLPAIAFPAGYNHEGLPVGMQVMGRAWEEPTLLRMALAADQVVERLKPAWHYDLLNG